jgi:hypothetical protein
MLIGSLRCTGCFFFVGAGLPGETRPHHKSVFDFDEVRSCFLCSLPIVSLTAVMGA